MWDRIYKEDKNKNNAESVKRRDPPHNNKLGLKAINRERQING